MKPLGRGAAGVAGVLAFAAILTGTAVSGAWRGDFRIDEAHKISETAFLRLWLAGDVRSPAWFTYIVDRTNPPAGKYVFGTAILLSGRELPPFPTLSAHRSIPAIHPEELSAPYRQFLPAVRAASAVATALTAALLAALLARIHGLLSAAIAVLFFALNDVTLTCRAWAVFDPLLALFFLAAIALVTAMVSASTTRRMAILAAALGVVTALAFQTRLNGLFALLIALPFLWLALRPSTAKALTAAAVTAGAFAVVTLALNPYYWSAPAAPAPPFSGHDGPLRPFQRLLQQKHDLEAIAAPLLEQQTAAGWTLLEKAAVFGWAVIFDLTGLLMVAGAVAGALFLAMRWRSLAPPLRIALLMSLAVTTTMVATLPLPWPRYLFVVIAPVALLAGFGATEVLQWFHEQFRQALATKRQ